MTVLNGLDCLVIEDEPLIAMSLEDIIEDLGGRVCSRASRLEAGLERARSDKIDIAFLDINLGGPRSYPIADILAERGIPFLFTSGYGGEVASRGYTAPVVDKPYDEGAIARGVERAMKRD